MTAITRKLPLSRGITTFITRDADVVLSSVNIVARVKCSDNKTTITIDCVNETMYGDH